MVSFGYVIEYALVLHACAAHRASIEFPICILEFDVDELFPIPYPNQCTGNTTTYAPPPPTIITINITINII